MQEGIPVTAPNTVVKLLLSSGRWGSGCCPPERKRIRMRRPSHRLPRLGTEAGIALFGLFFLLLGGPAPALASEDGPGAMAMSPDGQRIYVANNLLNTIDVIDTATNQVTTLSLPPADPMDLN